MLLAITVSSSLGVFPVNQIRPLSPDQAMDDMNAKIVARALGVTEEECFALSVEELDQWAFEALDLIPNPPSA